jgi:hypothetical protein
MASDCLRKSDSMQWWALAALCKPDLSVIPEPFTDTMPPIVITEAVTDSEWQGQGGSRCSERTHVVFFIMFSRDTLRNCRDTIRNCRDTVRNCRNTPHARHTIQNCRNTPHARHTIRHPDLPARSGMRAAAVSTFKICITDWGRAALTPTRQAGVVGVRGVACQFHRDEQANGRAQVAASWLTPGRS